MNNSTYVEDMEELKFCKSKFIYLEGHRFTRDERTQYYRCDALRKRLHQYVWEKRNGKVKDGYHVHHIDHNKGNNHISNLVALCGSKHLSLHGDLYAEENYDDMIRNLNDNARPAANEWHGSDEGLKFHKEHYQKYKHKLHEKVDLTCEQCKSEFKNIKNTRFCSNKCKSKWRREGGIDDIVRVCVTCCKEFGINKYSETVNCSRSCANTFKAKIKKEKASSS